MTCNLQAMPTAGDLREPLIGPAVVFVVSAVFAGPLPLSHALYTYTQVRAAPCALRIPHRHDSTCPHIPTICSSEGPARRVVFSIPALPGLADPAVSLRPRLSVSLSRPSACLCLGHQLALSRSSAGSISALLWSWLCLGPQLGPSEWLQ